mmetsp:Transcript_7563/g.17172  ORF Transcript_7563/g.17172 Transcript_7563/m.17172 type:complete len:220 (-) Transcript_7563:20-679(-)
MGLDLTVIQVHLLLLSLPCRLPDLEDAFFLRLFRGDAGSFLLCKPLLLQDLGNQVLCIPTSEPELLVSWLQSVLRPSVGVQDVLVSLLSERVLQDVDDVIVVRPGEPGAELLNSHGVGKAAFRQPEKLSKHRGLVGVALPRLGGVGVRDKLLRRLGDLLHGHAGGHAHHLGDGSEVPEGGEAEGLVLRQALAVLAVHVRLVEHVDDWPDFAEVLLNGVL